MNTLVINKSRIWSTLHESCEWGATIDGGMNRVTLNEDDRKVRDWLRSQGEAIGCQVKIDEMGSMFLIREGENNSIPPIAIGSHLDTQPAGGRYDGIVGVQTGLEILRVLHENNYKTYAPICVVNWTNEEGARFAKTMVSSGVWSGQISLQTAYKLKDINGYNFEEELKKIGYKGSVPASYEHNPLSAHFEVHIEQGTRLEKAGLDVGVVSGVKGIRWFEVEIFGQEGHTGTTPMEGRKDALAAASEMILCVEQTAQDHGGLGTVGVIEPLPQSPNTIPRYAKFSVDCRHNSNEALIAYTDELVEKLKKIGNERQIKYEIKETWHFKQLEFDSVCKKAIQDSANENNLSSTELYSGIGHDSCYTATRVPTAMIFIPCKNGVSHSPEEYASQEAVSNGAQTMLGAVLRYDDQLRSKKVV